MAVFVKILLLLFINTFKNVEKTAKNRL